MILKIAELEDIDGVLELHYRNQIDSIMEEDKKDGFVTTPFTKEQMESLINKESGLFIAIVDDKVIGYAMAASWGFWSTWPMFRFMIEDLHKLHYLGQQLTVYNSYQYGPICIDKSVRGTGVLERLFDFSRSEMEKRYPILVTFINKINPRSYQAHVRKLGLEVIQEFDYNNNKYWELVYDTSKPIQLQ